MQHIVLKVRYALIFVHLDFYVQSYFKRFNFFIFNSFVVFEFVVWTFGRPLDSVYSNPYLLWNSSLSIKQVASGQNILVILTEDGQVYTWGKGIVTGQTLDNSAIIDPPRQLFLPGIAEKNKKIRFF